MKRYYAKITNKSDSEISQILLTKEEELISMNALAELSRGFGTTPAVVLVDLPEGVEPNTFFPDWVFEEVIGDSKQ